MGRIPGWVTTCCRKGLPLSGTETTPHTHTHPPARTCELCYERETGQTPFWEERRDLAERGAGQVSIASGSPQEEGGGGSRWQRGAADDTAAPTLPIAHLHNPPAEADDDDMRGLI